MNPLLRPRRPAAAVLVAVALGLGVTSGCGGDDDAGDASLTRQEFIAKADAICAAGNSRIAAAAADVGGGGPPTGARAKALADTIAADIGRQADEIAALDPPDEIRAEVDALLAAARKGIATLKAQGPQALFSDDADPFAAANEAAGRLGLPSCAG
ncbi:MAG: hypothetical protein AB7V42_09930 [Thermoleophilia bacterium]